MVAPKVPFPSSPPRHCSPPIPKRSYLASEIQSPSAEIQNFGSHAQSFLILSPTTTDSSYVIPDIVVSSLHCKIYAQVQISYRISLPLISFIQCSFRCRRNYHIVPGTCRFLALGGPIHIQSLGLVYQWSSDKRAQNSQDFLYPHAWRYAQDPSLAR